MDLLEKFASILKDKPGVFIIGDYNSKNLYLGSANNLKVMVSNHVRELIAGEHFNSLLQRLYNENEGDIYLQVIFTRDLNEAKMLSMKLAVDKKVNPKIINPLFRRMSRKERELLMTLAMA